MKKLFLLINTVVIVLIVGGLAWIASMFISFGGDPYTDNARVHQDLVPVHSRVQGFVKRVCFEEFERVERGDTLLVIEDAEYRLRLAQAEAGYRNALTAKSAMGTVIRTSQNNIEVAGATLSEVEVQLRQATTDLRRYEQLLAANSVTRQEYDAVRTRYEALLAKQQTLTHQRQTTALVKTEQSQRIGQHDAQIAVAEAALALARLELGYTVILAPCSGYMTRKTVYEGELMQPGRKVAAVVNEQECFVVANFRERQLRHIQVGSKVEMTVDAVQGYRFEGVVTAISDATASEYALVPQDNSAGNFVKVEQRVPVKIHFTEQNDAARLQELRSGLNVECRVRRK